MRDTTDLMGHIFDEAGVTGSLHACVIGAPEVQLSFGGDDPVVLASVFKIVVAVAFARAVAVHAIDERERSMVPARYRIGGIGTAGCKDEVEMSLRDLATLMITMSDNAATDVVADRVGAAAIQAVLDDLAMTSTRIDGHCNDLFASMYEDVGLDPKKDFQQALDAVRTPAIKSIRALDADRTMQASTPRDVTTLLDAIWTDTAAGPSACEFVRSIMQQQIWPHRLSAGFDDSVSVAGKTGTLITIRNEAGVVTYPDGSQYAVAVFLRCDSVKSRQPGVDAAIGRAARLAVDWLRSR